MSDKPPGDPGRSCSPCSAGVWVHRARPRAGVGHWAGRLCFSQLRSAVMTKVTTTRMRMRTRRMGKRKRTRRKTRRKRRTRRKTRRKSHSSEGKERSHPHSRGRFWTLTVG